MTIPGIKLYQPSEGKLFKKILGSQWNELHADIQKRFDQNPEPGKPLYYKGGA